MFDKRGTNSTIQDFILADAGSGVDVTIEIKFIAPGVQTTGGYYSYIQNDTDEADMIMMKNSDTETFEVAQAVIYNPGNEAYLKRTGASTYVAGAKYKTKAYLPNTSTGYTPTAIRRSKSRNVNSDGYITGFTFPGTYNEADRGTFSSITTQYLPIITADDTYTPALSAVESEDVFDTEDEFADKAFSTGKTFTNSSIKQYNLAYYFTYNYNSFTIRC